MAYSPSEKYPGAVDSDPNYQGGKFRDNNPSTTNNGSPLKAIDRNELLARDEAIMNDAGFEYNGLPDTPQDSQMFRAYKASLGNGANLLSNHNFLIQTPDDSQPLPSSTPTSYPPGHQIFSGVFANETSGITNLTYIDGRVSFSGGDLYFAVPNTGAIARLDSSQLVASVADFDGKPRTRGVSFGLVGDEYRVTVGVDALEDSGGGETLLGSVKFEQGSVATGHESESGRGQFYSFNNVSDAIENCPPIGSRVAISDYYGAPNPNNSGVLFFTVESLESSTIDGGKWIGVDSLKMLTQNLKRPYDVTAWGAGGITDPTSAIQAALDYQNANKGAAQSEIGDVAGYCTPVFLPKNTYEITEELVSSNEYMTIISDQAVLKKSSSFSGTYGLSNDGKAFRTKVQGIQFLDFEEGLYLNSNNANSGRNRIIECGFFGSTSYAFRHNCQSSHTTLENCVFRGNVHDIYNEKGDLLEVSGGWIQREGGQLTEDYDGAIVNDGVLLQMHNVLMVPQPENNALEPCWIKNNTGSIYCDGVRFGDEAAGLTAVNNFSSGSNETQDPKRSVILNNCSKVASGSGGSPAVRIFEIPNILSMVDNDGFGQASGTLIDWSSSVDATAQQAKIDYARDGFALGGRFYIEARGVNDETIASNLKEFTNSPSRGRWYSEQGEITHRYEFLKTAINAGDVYYRHQAISYDASGNAKGVRAETRVEATGGQGGAKQVFSTSENAGAEAVDRWQLQDGGTFEPYTDNTYDAGSATNRIKEIFSANGTINTSDERLKSFEEISEAEKAVALKIKGSIRKFKWNDAVEREGLSGSKARFHFGVGAQAVKSIFESEGLNPDEYSLFCRDEWMELDGSVVRANEDGNYPEGSELVYRYGIRYSELSMFILSAL